MDQVQTGVASQPRGVVMVAMDGEDRQPNVEVGIGDHMVNFRADSIFQVFTRCLVALVRGKEHEGLLSQVSITVSRPQAGFTTSFDNDLIFRRKCQLI